MSLKTNPMVLAMCLGGLLALPAVAGSAWADKDERNAPAVETPPAAAAPAIQPPAVSGVDAAILRLQQSQRLAGLAVDWTGLQTYYAAGGAALWTTESGYNVLGAYLQRQLPKAIAAGMPANYVSRAVIDPADPNTAYVTFAGYGVAAGQHVWRTRDLAAGASAWEPAGAGLRHGSALAAGTPDGTGEGSWPEATGPNASRDAATMPAPSSAAARRRWTPVTSTGRPVDASRLTSSPGRHRRSPSGR